MNNKHKTLAQLYSEHKGKVSDKWTRYFSEYDTLFEEFRDRSVRMLEIGVQNGGGLEIWARYFRNGLKFIGCDIDPNCAALRFDDPRIELVIGDANDDSTQKEILSHSPELDIVIDDGSHWSGDIVRSFLRYFSNLVDGGVYVVEDLHTSYWKEYEGGLFDPFSSITFFKRLIDIVNSEHWGVERPPADILAGFQEKYGVRVTAEILQHIHSIKFTNSLCVIMKSRSSDNKLGRRFVVGDVAAVKSDLKQYDESFIVPLPQNQNPWSVRIRPPDEELPEREQEVMALTEQMEAKEQALQAMAEQVTEKERSMQGLSAQLAEKEQAVHMLSAQLAEINNSRAWKIALLLRRIRILFAPPNSRRARVLRRMINAIFSPFIKIRRNLKSKRESALIKSSGLFDETWYLAQNPDVALAKENPLLHYLHNGGFEGRDPSPGFSSQRYLDNNPDVRAAGINPLVHYLRFGKKEERSPFRDQIINTHLQNKTSEESKFSHSLRMFRRYLLQQHPRFFHFLRNIIPPAIRLKITKYLVGDEDNTIRAPLSRGSSKLLENPLVHEENVKEYETLLRRIQEISQLNTKEVSIKAPRLISLREDHLALMQAAQTIKLPSSQTPKVSVVIPVHNNAKLLLECLSSLQNDVTLNDFEICVVDDSSDGENREIIENITGIKQVHNQERIGFGRSCNIGAQISEGEFLLFLNDDAQMMEGAINSLLHTFETHSETGAAGPKMLYPSGLLQEAGCAINIDGTVTMIGHGDDPVLQRYNYLREVDYVSGVCLMVRKDHFNAVGGFEEAYTPAYYEDVDLCLKLREKGLKIFYNPDSVVVHHLSATTSGLYGQKTKLDLVARNRQKLLERWQPKIDELNQIRLIAFYLPQFHPIPENDIWWGKGFTEWQNVVSAHPFFGGHYQPHLPADLGFYDLRVPEVMEQQAELAKRYGIYGFCYHYYWFNGKRLLEMPLERMLETGRPDFPFCLCWANENWSRKWDGGEKDILIAQKHSDEDDLSVILDLIRYFKHPNYIRVDGKPMFLVYQVNLFPDFKRTARIWREECRRQRIGEIHLVMAETFSLSLEQSDPKEFGMDAAVQFPPHGYWEPIGPANMASDFRGQVLDYKNTALHFIKKKFPGFVYYQTVMPSWDNTARMKNRAVIFANSSPGTYQAWLEEAIRNTREQYSGDHRIVFINAWNEWAEGNHLEPDQRYGHDFLQATRNAVEYWLIGTG